MTVLIGTTKMAREGRRASASPQQGNETAVAEFIRKNGVTRCPTACVLPTQGEVPPSDRAALSAYATGRERQRQAKAAERSRPFWPIVPPPNLE
jgi:hypothetical protein